MILIGHENTKKQITIALESAVKRNNALPHMLFAGAPGCGKSSMAKYVAELRNVDFLSASPDVISEKDGVLDVMELLNHNGYNEVGDRIDKITPTILFIDEIHRLSTKAQEDLGIAMEEFRIPSGTPNKFYWIPLFTLVGATTDDGKLTGPFRDRLKMRFVFETYTFRESVNIVKAHANRLKTIITDKAAEAIAQRGRGIPRILVGYLERARDYAISIDASCITSAAVETVFEGMGIDKEGLSKTELKILKALQKSRSPVGMDNLAIIVNEAPRTLKMSIEPFLIRKGLIIRSGKGRVLTRKGREYIEQSSKIAGGTFIKQQIDAGHIRK